MTTPGQTGRAKPILRTTDATADRVRALAGRMSSKLEGRRVTQDELISALIGLAALEEDQLLTILRTLTEPAA
jgi:hypothetical protein